jgi:uncharacterized membrane protein YphA (DoxX/SURF4 family)
VHHVSLACRCLIGVIFFVSFSTKVAPGSFRAFVESLRAMNVLPAPVVRVSAIGVVSAELVVAASLVWDASARVGALLAAALLVAFAAAIITALVGNTTATCRCFGAGGGRLGMRHVVRNVFLLAACLVVVFGGTGHGEPAVTAAAAGAGVVAAVMVLGMDSVAELFGRSRPAI